MLMGRIFLVVAGFLLWSPAIRVRELITNSAKDIVKNTYSTFLLTGYQAKRNYSEVECKYPTSYTLLPNPRRVSMEFHDGYGNPDKDVIGEKSTKHNK